MDSMHFCFVLPAQLHSNSHLPTAVDCWLLCTVVEPLHQPDSKLLIALASQMAAAAIG
jgi:hypothetical protein